MENFQIASAHNVNLRSWEFGVERVGHVTRVYIIVREAVSCRQCANPEDHVSLKLIRNKSYLPSLTKDHRSFMLIQYQSYPFSQTKDHRSFRLIPIQELSFPIIFSDTRVLTVQQC